MNSTLELADGDSRDEAGPDHLFAGARSGQVLGGSYTLLELVGRGGMAEVYAAEHTRLGRRFAVKVLRTDGGPSAIARFRGEARAIARVRNDFVIEVVDCGESNGAPYLVMELLSGQDLRSLLSDVGPLPIPRAVHLIWEACQGVSAVHRAGLVHRDIKPENLYVTRRSTGEDWCKVLDFGVAKTELSGHTVDGALLGTVRYMAPEQMQDGASAGPSVDTYALAAVLYELLCAASPHSGTSMQELMFKVLNAEPVRIETRRREVPEALAAVVHRALARAPAGRFASVDDFARELEPFLPAASARTRMATETVDLEQVSRKPSRSGRRWLVVASLALAAGSGFALRGLFVRSVVAASPAPTAQPVPVAIVPSSSEKAAVPVLNEPARVVVAPSAAAFNPAPQHPKIPTPIRAAGSPPLRERFDDANPYPR